MFKALDVLARKVEIIGIFSDWPATVTYYANCRGLNKPPSLHLRGPGRGGQSGLLGSISVRHMCAV